MTIDEWMREARRYARHRYCYEQMIEDSGEDAMKAFFVAMSPYEFVEYVGDKFALDRADQNWGINDGAEFKKVELV